MIRLSQYLQRYGWLSYIALLHLDSAIWLPVTCSSSIDKLLINFDLAITAQVVPGCDLTDALPFMLVGDTLTRSNFKRPGRSPGFIGGFCVRSLSLWGHGCLVDVCGRAAPWIVDGHVYIHVYVEVDLGLDPLRISVVLRLDIAKIVDSVLDQPLTVDV